MQTEMYSVQENEWGQKYILTADGRALLIPAGGIPDAPPVDEDAEGDAGGGAEREADGGEGEGNKTLETEGEGDASRAAGDTGKPQGKTVPYERFSKVNSERQSWRKLGKSPEEVAARLARADRIERAARGKDEDERTPEDESLDRASEALGRVIDHRYGRGADENMRSTQEVRDMQALAHAKQGLNYLRETLEDHRIPYDDKTFPDWEVRVGDEMARDPELHARFKNPVTQQAAIEESFGRLRDTVINPALAASGAAKLQAGHRRRASALSSPRSVGAPAIFDKELAPPKDMTDPVARAQWWEKTKSDVWDELQQNE